MANKIYGLFVHTDPSRFIANRLMRLSAIWLTISVAVFYDFFFYGLDQSWVAKQKQTSAAHEFEYVVIVCSFMKNDGISEPEVIINAKGGVFCLN